MPVAGGPFIQKTGILLEVDAANAASYPGTGTTWTNLFRPGTYNGTINGTVGFNSTDAYGALTFPGTASTYVDFGNVGDLSVSWSFQVAIKPAPSASGNYTILSYSSGSGTGSLTFELDYSSSTQTAVLLAYSSTGSAQVVHRLTGSVATGSWSIINASYGATVLGMFVNGRPTDYALTTGSTVGYNANNRLYFGGTFGTTSSFYTGSAASLLTYNADVPNTRIIQNYNAFATRFGLPPSNFFVYATDPDAFRFIEVANITSSVQAAAVSNLVVGLKSANLWDKMQAIYPFVGGTAFSHKWNLKDPRDTDAAFRIQYFGTVTHTNLGISGSGYAGTYYYPLTSNIQFSSSAHIGVYTTKTGTGGGGIGNTTDASGLSITINYNLGGQTNYQLNFPTWKTFDGASATDVGLYVASRTSATDVALYRRINTGNTSTTATEAHSGTNNNDVKIFSGQYSGWTGAAGFASMGYGLTATDVINLDTIISAYQTALGRKPF